MGDFTHLPEFDDAYAERVTEAFWSSCHQIPDREYLAAWDMIGDFINQFWPVLRHYRPEIVGQCLALAWDDPKLSRDSQVHGFGAHMLAGNHPADQDSLLGSYRDDGSYLSIQAWDYFAKAGRQ